MTKKKKALAGGTTGVGRDNSLGKANDPNLARFSAIGTRSARRAWKAALSKHIKPGQLLHVCFEHDDWCAIYTAERACSCNANRVLVDHTGRVLARVQNAGFFDPLELIEVTL